MDWDTFVSSGDLEPAQSVEDVDDDSSAAEELSNDYEDSQPNTRPSGQEGSTPLSTADNPVEVERKQVQRYSSEETKDVWTWKLLVLMLVLVAAGFSSASTLQFIRGVQQDTFLAEVRAIFYV